MVHLPLETIAPLPLFQPYFSKSKMRNKLRRIGEGIAGTFELWSTFWWNANQLHMRWNILPMGHVYLDHRLKCVILLNSPVPDAAEQQGVAFLLDGGSLSTAQ